MIKLICISQEKYMPFSSNKDRDRIIKVILFWKSLSKNISISDKLIDCVNMICSWSA